MWLRVLAAAAATAAVLVGGWLFVDTGGDTEWNGAWALTSGTYAGQPLILVDTHPVKGSGWSSGSTGHG